MDLRHLRAFTAVAVNGHFGRAAEQLHLAQPALSQQIKQLERELGVELFERTTRRVSMTDAGRQFATRAHSVLAEIDEARAEMALMSSGYSGRVRLGFVGTATYDVLPRVAHQVRANLPDVQLELHGEVLAPALINGLIDRTYDLALLRPGPEGSSNPEINLRILRREHLVAAVPVVHRLAKRRRIRLRELADEPFVVHPSANRSAMHAAVLDACAAVGFTPQVVAEAAETATLMALVAAGQGVAVVPAPVTSLAMEGITYLSLVSAPSIDLALGQRSGKSSPVTERVARTVTRLLS